MTKEETYFVNMVNNQVKRAQAFGQIDHDMKKVQ